MRQRCTLIWCGCSIVYLHLASEDMKVRAEHKSSRMPWLPFTSWKCNICHDLPKWLLPSAPAAASVKGSVVPCKLLALAERYTFVFCASLPIYLVQFTTNQIGTHLLLPPCTWLVTLAAFRLWTWAIPGTTPSPHGCDIRHELQLKFCCHKEEDITQRRSLHISRKCGCGCMITISS